MPYTACHKNIDDEKHKKKEIKQRRKKMRRFSILVFFKASFIMKKSVMVGHKKVDKWCGHAGNICFTEKFPDHLFKNMMRILLMNDDKKELQKILDEKEKGLVTYTALWHSFRLCVFTYHTHWPDPRLQC